MKRNVFCLLCLPILAGCAAGPDVTLLGGMASAGAPPAAAQGVTVNGAGQVARASGTDTAGHTDPLAMANEGGLDQTPGTPIEALDANAPRQAARLDGTPLVAAPAGNVEAAPRLKTAAEIAADEAELRRLAGRAPERRTRGLWSASVDLLKKLRNSHGEEAIGKIEADPQT